MIKQRKLQVNNAIKQTCDYFDDVTTLPELHGVDTHES